MPVWCFYCMSAYPLLTLTFFFFGSRSGPMGPPFTAVLICATALPVSQTCDCFALEGPHDVRLLIWGT
uniref:Secreted protein n=1 Tax=Anguilla anguilla TaxID=7936 RepID=A0A0E9R4G7_ANGAN